MIYTSHWLKGYGGSMQIAWNNVGSVKIVETSNSDGTDPRVGADTGVSYASRLFRHCQEVESSWGNFSHLLHCW